MAPRNSGIGLPDESGSVFGDALASRELLSANVAVQCDLPPAIVASLEHALDPPVEARLTDVVHRLRSAWISGPAALWGDIHPIHKDALGDFEKRIALSLRERFFEFGQLLCGFEVLVLKLEELRRKRENALLRGTELLDNRSILDEIAALQSDVDRLLSSLERRTYGAE